VIHQVAESISIPVIGNGSIDAKYDICKLREQYSVSGLMVGRAALGNPWLFQELKSKVDDGVASPEPSIGERWELVMRYSEIMKGHYTHLREDMLLGLMKGRLVSFVTGFPGARKLRNRLSRLKSWDELYALRDESLSAIELRA
jgi:tRNA-dihydrouridine synthase